MDIDKVKQTNPQLFWDMVANNIIPYSTAGGLAWGNPVTSLFAESFLGGPHQPDYGSLPLPSDYSTPTRLAESGIYPKPWRSSAQRLQNANFTNIGPYAALVGWITFDKDGNGIISRCCSSNESTGRTKPSRLWGRWGVATSGPQAGSGAYFPQDWYNPSEGTFDANYWNNYFSDQGSPLNPEWQTRKNWWDSINKITIKTYFANTGIPCEIEIAQSFFEFGTPEYFAGIDLAIYNDFSLDLLFVMVSIAALTRWL